MLLRAYQGSFASKFVQQYLIPQHTEIRFPGSRGGQASED